MKITFDVSDELYARMEASRIKYAAVNGVVLTKSAFIRFAVEELVDQIIEPEEVKSEGAPPWLK